MDEHFQTYETKTDRYIGLTASAMGVKLDEDGNPMIDPTDPTKYIWDDDNGAEIYSRLALEHNRAELISAINDHDGDQISGAKLDLSAEGKVLIEAINDYDGGTVQIKASHIELNGETIAGLLKSTNLETGNITCGDLTVNGDFLASGADFGDSGQIGCGSIDLGGSIMDRCEFTVDGVHQAYFIGTDDVDFDRAAAKAEGAAAVGLALDTVNHQVKVTPTSPTKYVVIGVQVGSLVYSESAHNYTVIANAKIGDGVMANGYGQSGTEAWDAVTVSGSWGGGDSGNSNSYTAVAANGKRASTGMRLEATNAWDSGNRYVYLYDSVSSGGTKRAHVTISMPGASSASWSKSGDTVTVTIGGKTYSHTF